MERPLYSIITVVKNDPIGFEKTIESVFAQDRELFEYIVIDGKSDSCLCYEKYMDKIDFFLSESDSGIYDAMNKGIKNSHGQYIIFMNAGDCFVNGQVLMDIKDYLGGEREIIYGDYITNKTIRKGLKKYSILSVICERMIVHQTVFSKRECFEDNFFDTNYKIVADRKWAYQCMRKGYRFKKVNVIVVNYDLNGISSNQENFDQESRQLQIELFGNIIIPFFALKRFLKKCMRSVL